MNNNNNNQQTPQSSHHTSLYPNLHSQRSTRPSLSATPLKPRASSTTVPATPRNNALNGDTPVHDRQNSGVTQSASQSAVDVPRTAASGTVSLSPLIEARDASIHQDKLSHTVTLYGFTLEQLDIVLPRFALIGDIVHVDKSDHTQSTHRSVTPNWVHVTYGNVVHAQIATQLNGTVVNGLMIGVQYKQSHAELNVSQLTQTSAASTATPYKAANNNIYVQPTHLTFTQRLYNYLTQCMFANGIVCMSPLQSHN